MKKEDLINLGDGDNLDHCLCKGHLTDDDFNKLFAMSWSGDPLSSDSIAHEYWVEGDDGSWECSNKNDPKATPVTVTDA